MIVSAFLRFMRSAKPKGHALIGLTCLLICMLVVMATNPAKTTLAVLLIPFFLLGLGLYLISLSITSRLSVLSTKVQYVVAFTFSVCVVMILLLQSLNQLTVRDGIIMVLLVALLGVYVSRADFLQK